MAEIIKTFPNIPVSHWTSLRGQFKKSIPGTISHNYLASVLGITETSARANIMPSLRQIGFVDNEGKTNQDLLKQFRDDTSYPKFCETIMKKMYPQELLDAFPDKNSDRNRIKSWFMNHIGVGEAAANRMVALFVLLLEADPNAGVGNNGKSKETKNKPKSKSKPAPIKVPTKPVLSDNVNHQEQEKPLANNSQSFKHNSSPDLNINIQIHISSDASPDQIKSIFENMAKYIYKN